MSENDAELKIGANITGLTGALNQASATVRRSMDDMKGHVEKFGGAFEKLNGMLAGFAVILGGGAVFREAIESVIEETTAVSRLSYILGITMEEASGLNKALEITGITSDEVETVTSHLTRTMRKNAEAFTLNGIALKDSDGSYRDSLAIMRDTLAFLQQIPGATERNIASVSLLGKSWLEAVKMQRLTTDAMADGKKLAEDLGEVLGTENVESLRDYRTATNSAKVVLEAFSQAIGEAVMPLLTDLGTWFRTQGPAAVREFKIVMLDLEKVAYGMALAFKEAWNGISTAFTLGGEFVAGIAFVVWQALSGKNPAQVKAAWDDMWDQMTNKARAAQAQMAGDLAFFNGRILRVQSELDKLGPSGAAPGGEAPAEKPPGGRNFVDPAEVEARKKALDEKFKAEIAALTLEMEATKAAGDERVRMAGEIAIKIGEKYGYQSKEFVAAQKKILDEAEKVNAALLKLEDARAEHASTMDKLGIDIERAHYDTLLNLGDMSAEQRLAKELELNDRLYQIDLEALARKQTLAAGDVAAQEAISQQILELEKRHQLQRVQINGQMAVESNQIWADLGNRMGSLWDQGTQAMLNGTLTFSNAMRAIGAQLVGWFATDVVGKKVKAWFAGEVAQTGATATGTGARTAIEMGAALKSVVLHAGASIKKIMMSAYETFAGIYAAIAAIPYIGPFLAPGMAIAGMGIVAGMAGRIASAAGGYDIPRGTNPLTQLHSGEMVLPQTLADKVRGMPDGGGSGGSPIFNINITAWDGQDVKRVLMNHGDSIMKSLRAQYRGFATT